MFDAQLQILKLSLLASGAVLWSFHAKAQSHPTGGVLSLQAPCYKPFIEELGRMPIKTALPGGVSDLSLPENGGFAPNGTVYPQVTGKDVLTTYMNSLERIVALQQRNSGNNVQFPPKRFYVLRARQATHVFHPDPPYDRGASSGATTECSLVPLSSEGMENPSSFASSMDCILMKTPIQQRLANKYLVVSGVPESPHTSTMAIQRRKVMEILLTFTLRTPSLPTCPNILRRFAISFSGSSLRHVSRRP